MAKTKEPPTPDEFVEHTKEIFETYKYDTERCHMELDEYISEVMELLGYKEGIRIFRTAPKWYA